MKTYADGIRACIASLKKDHFEAHRRAWIGDSLVDQGQSMTAYVLMEAADKLERTLLAEATADKTVESIHLDSQCDLAAPHEGPCEAQRTETGKLIKSKPVEPPVCAESCGKTSGGVFPMAWASTMPQWCSPACRALGRPVRPAGKP